MAGKDRGEMEVSIRSNIAHRNTPKQKTSYRQDVLVDEGGEAVEEAADKEGSKCQKRKTKH